MYPKIDLAVLESVLKTILFFDAFGKSVSKANIDQYLIEQQSNIESIEISLAVLEDLEIIKKEDDRYSLFARNNSEIKIQSESRRISLRNKFLFKVIGSLETIRGVYSFTNLNDIETIVLDLSGLNKPNLANKICNWTSKITSKKVVYVSRFYKPDSTNIFQSFALAKLSPIINPVALEKLINRDNENYKIFPNRVVNHNGVLKPLRPKSMAMVRKPVFNVNPVSDCEFFEVVQETINAKDLLANWDKNQILYKQWFQPRLSKLNRKYQLV